MDLICVSGNLGAAYLGLNVLEREKKNWSEGKNPNLDKYRQFVGAYLKPELQSGIIDALVESDIYPSFGYFINKGLGSTIKALVRDSGLGAKIYVDRIPFEGNSFDTGKELGIDPVTAALNGGDDYRLLFTIPIRNHDRFRHDFQTFDIIGRPATIIGKQGAGVEAMNKEVQKFCPERNVNINVIEVKRPDMDAQLVAERIAEQLEARASFRRSMKQAMSKAIWAGAKGVKTMVSGRLDGAEIARSENYHEGSVPLQTLRADIDYGFAEAKTTFGQIGVKVWIYKGEVLGGVPREEVTTNVNA